MLKNTQRKALTTERLLYLQTPHRDIRKTANYVYINSRTTKSSTVINSDAEIKHNTIIIHVWTLSCVEIWA